MKPKPWQRLMTILLKKKQQFKQSVEKQALKDDLKDDHKALQMIPSVRFLIEAAQVI